MEEWVDYVEDMNGERVVVGDTIAYAAVTGRSANLRVGTVREIVPKKEKYASWDTDKEYGTSTTPCKLRVDVDRSAFSSIDKPALIQADFKRFVKLPKRDEVTKLMAEVARLDRVVRKQDEVLRELYESGHWDGPV